MHVKPIVKAVLFALAVQRYGAQAWTWGIWDTGTALVIMPAPRR